MTHLFKGHRDQAYGHVTYSQHGEDLVVVNIFKLLGIEKPSYLDVGCHHPVNISNTYLLYTRGSRGTVVDANDHLMGYWAAARPEDRFLSYGIRPEGSPPGDYPYYRYDQFSGLNSLCKEEIEKTRLTDETKVRTTTLNTIVKEYCSGEWPHFLSLDIEGFDLDVFMQAHMTKENSPVVVCVEARPHETTRWCELFNDVGYYAETRMGENLIAIRDAEYWKLWLERG